MHLDELQSERLRFEPYTLSDFYFVKSLLQDPRVMRFVSPDGRPYTDEQTNWMVWTSIGPLWDRTSNGSPEAHDIWKWWTDWSRRYAIAWIGRPNRVRSRILVVTEALAHGIWSRSRRTSDAACFFRGREGDYFSDSSGQRSISTCRQSEWSSLGSRYTVQGYARLRICGWLGAVMSTYQPSTNDTIKRSLKK